MAIVGVRGMSPDAKEALLGWRLLAPKHLRHGRACPGHPRLFFRQLKEEARGCPARPGMTNSYL
jgi:hypothetical protein